MSRQEIDVRATEPSDADSIARIHVATWQTAYVHVFPEDALRRLTASLDRRISFWRDRIESLQQDAFVLVACDDANIVGFADGGPSRDEGADRRDEAELYAIYVLPEAWGTGAGQALNAGLLERLHAAGYEQAVLWVLDDNPRARRFYETAGWILDGHERVESFMGTTVREVRYTIALRPGLH